MSSSLDDGVRVLPRGGVILPSSVGQIQYGAVPETIKDTIDTPEGVPTIFVVPRRFFALDRGILLAELEFPAYWNRFVVGRRTTVVCRPDQRQALEAVLSEACFGPARIDPHEIATGSDAFPDLLAEMAWLQHDPHWGRRNRLDDLVDIRELDENGRAELWDGVAVHHDEQRVVIVENGVPRARFVGDPPVPPPLRDNLSPQKHFRRPRLGVSVIGSGHGFDPGNRTSGFLMWIDGRGVLVDPPVDALDWLASYDLSGRDIDSLILTHCHADHDAGALQKILHEERITIYTTATVMSSFVAKYARLTGLEPGAFRRLFDFVPVRHGEPITMHGAEVTFRYSLHTVPCVGLEVLFGGKGLVYPSDTLNDVQTFLRLRDEGIMSQNRARELAAFPWHHELILHEAGVPPIHTPVSALAQLDEAVKKRLYLVHVSARSLPPDAGLHVAPTGLESTIDLHATGSDGTHVLEALDVMARVDILRRLPASRAAEFVRYVQRVSFREGQRILTRGEAGDALYFIVNGTVAVVLENHEERTYGAYDYLGETALVEDAPRSADAYAKTDVSALRVSAPDFRRLLRGTRIATRLRHLARMRELPSWQVLQSSSALGDLTSNQKTQLQALMTTATFEASAPLSDATLLVASGEVEVVRDDEVVALLRRGDLAGDVKAYGTLPEGALSFRCRTPVSGFLLSDEGFAEFLHRNPGAAMRLAHALGERLQAGC